MTVYSFDLLATLKAFTTASTNDGAMLAGCVSIGDDGGGEFIFGPSPTNRGRHSSRCPRSGSRRTGPRWHPSPNRGPE
jgi:hypothetical protein